MSEVSTRGPGEVAGISASGLLLSCSALLFFSLASHTDPLFSCLAELVTFLGPLFFTTFLVLLALPMLSPRISSVMGVCLSILKKFQTNGNEENGAVVFSEDSEVYRIIFEGPDMESSLYGSGNEEAEPPVDKFCVQNASSPSKREGNRPVHEIANPDVEPGALFMEKFWCETEYSEEVEVEAKVKAEDGNSMKVVDQEKQTFHDRESDLMTGPEAMINDDGEDDIKNNNHNNIFSRRRQGSRRFSESGFSLGEIDRNLGSFGSMSRSKEWKRTLACKLFEERHNSEGGGMDSLWETCEDESSTRYLVETRKEKKIKGWKERVTIVLNVEEEDEVDGDEARIDGKFCCLHALRLSAGRKMGLGMGRPNIARISKAFRGIGWLHHHRVSHGNGKKG